MPTGQDIPAELKRAPFSIAEAHAAGVSTRALKGRRWRRLGRELYCWRSWQPDPWLLLEAWSRMHPSMVFAGRTAAWMHGLDCKPADPVEAIAPTSAAYRTCHGLRIRHCDLPPEDVSGIRGLSATSVHRTLRDICLQAGAPESLVILDMALKAGLTDRPSMARYVHALPAAPGARRMRDLIGIAEPAESPMETRLRWLLLRGGLPAPRVQVDLTDGAGQFVGRADMCYTAERLVVEYDGGNHRDRLVADDRRQNRLIRAGYTVLRFTSADLRERPDVVVAQVRGALAGLSGGRPAAVRFVQKGPPTRAAEVRFAQKGR